MFSKAKNDFDKIFGDLFCAKMRVDIQEREENYLLTAELPGVMKDEITLQYADDSLTISVDRDEVLDDEEYLRKERKSSYQERSFVIPSVDFDSCKATLEMGILSIVLPKIKVEGKKINID